MNRPYGTKYKYMKRIHFRLTVLHFTFYILNFTFYISKGSPYGAKLQSLIFIYKQVAPTGHKSQSYIGVHFYISFFILNSSFHEPITTVAGVFTSHSIHGIFLRNIKNIAERTLFHSSFFISHSSFPIL